MNDTARLTDAGLPMLPLPPQPAGTPWPTDAWPVLEEPATRIPGLAPLIEAAFADGARFGETHALLVIRGGAILSERYAAGPAADRTTFPSWSMAKSLTQALLGTAVLRGVIDPAQPTGLSEWQAPGDPRSAITLDHLLAMASGLDWHEAYDPALPSDVIEMLFGRGRDDVAAYAARAPLVAEPGRQWLYSSGSTNLIVRRLMDALGTGQDAFVRYMHDALFSPVGITSAIPKFDRRGTWIGSSYCYMTARDFARLGLLYLRDGEWDGRRLLPRGWVARARTPVAAPMPEDEPRGYGAHWWLMKEHPGVFYAAGYEGQYLVLDPVADTIIVRHGRSEARKENVRRALVSLVGLLRAAAS